MRATGRNRWMAAVAVAASVVSGGAARDAAAAESLAGQLLIASAAIQDPRFHHAVVLMLKHDKTGAFGIIINHPVTERPIASLLAAAQNKTGGKRAPKDRDQDAEIEGTIRVFSGGPVQPQYGFVVHSPDYRRDSTLTIDNLVAMTADKEVLRDIGRHQGPNKAFFALGYTGWSAGQVEGEITRRDWFTTPADADLIFDLERGAVWERALARRTHDL